VAALLALASAGIFGGADFLGGYASRSAPARSVVLLAYLVGGVAALLALAVLGGTWSAGAVVYGAAAGVAGMAGLVLMFRGFARGRFQLVSPAAAVMSGVVPVAWGLIAGEQPRPATLVGLLLAPLGIWLLAGGRARLPAPTDLDSLAHGLAAGVGFGVFFVCLAQTPDDAGMVPLVTARASSITGALIVGALAAGPMLPQAGRLAALASGCLDVFANGLFLAASRAGDLIVVGALVALFPASNAVLARIVLKERLRARQRLGFVLALAAAVALAA
jgi:drug/metabolite transporter (DMT)-like permease